MRWALVAAGTALCLAGLACSRRPVVLYDSGRHTVGGITTDATNVYWVVLDQDGSHVTTMPKGGGQPLSVTSARQGIGHSATDGEHMYWTAPGGVLFRAPKTGGAAQELASSEGRHARWSRLALDAGFVYWVNEGRDGSRSDRLGQVLRVAKAGGPPKVIASDQVGVDDVAVNREHVFWATQDGVWRWSKTTETTDHFVDAQIPARPPYGLALDDQWLYWSDASAVRRSPLSGGPPETVFSSGHGGMLLGGGWLYLVTEKALVRVPKSGSTAATIATWAGWDDGPTDLAVDESGVYWTVNSQSRGSASVMGLAK